MASTAYSVFSAVDAKVFLIRSESAKEGRAPDAATGENDGPLPARPARLREFASLPRGLMRARTPRPAQLPAASAPVDADAAVAVGRARLLVYCDSFSSAVEELQVDDGWFDDIAEGDEGRYVALRADGSPIDVAAPTARGGKGAEATATAASLLAQERAQAHAREPECAQRRAAAARALAAIGVVLAGVIAPGVGCLAPEAARTWPSRMPAALMPH